MKKLIALLTLLPVLVFAQNYPSPTYKNLTITGTGTAPTQTLGVNNTTLATTAYAANERDCPSVLDHGGDNTGTNNNDTALVNTLAVGPAGKACAYFPAGTYKFGANVAYTMPNASASVRIYGAGADHTLLQWAAGGGLTINYVGAFNSARIRDLSFTTGTTNTGIALLLNQTNASIPNPGNSALTDITNVVIRGSDGYAQTNYWSVGVKAAGVSNVNFDGLFISGNGTAAYSTFGTGLWTVGSSSVPAVVYNVTNSTFNALNVGIQYDNWTQGMTAVNSNFTGDSIGVNVPASVTGLDQLSIANSQFNSVTGVNLGSALESTQITSSLFIVPNTGIGISATYASLLQVVGNSFGPSSYSNVSGYGISVTNSLLIGGSIVGNSFYHLPNTAIVLGASSTNLVVSSNMFGSNGSNIANSGTGNQIGGALIGKQVLTSSGTFTPDAGTNAILLECVGGGGAGGGTPATSGTTNSVGGSGGAGAYARGFYRTGFAGVSYTIGAAGVGASGANGGNGGQTSFGSLITAPGGNGGTVGASITGGVAQTLGGATSSVATGGTDVNESGAAGPAAIYSFGTFLGSSPGANSPVGSGGTPANQAAGNNASGNGAGGSGASSNSSTAARSGGNGSIGACFVTEFN